jgi:hypothetical protein
MKKPIRSRGLVILFLLAALVSPSTTANVEASGWRCRTRSPIAAHCRRCPRHACSSWAACGRCPSMAAHPATSPPSSNLAKGVFVSPTGKSYAFIETGDPGTETELAEELERRLSPADRLAASNSAEFLGHDRKIAKTSISHASVEEFPGLAAVLDSLPPDSQLSSHDPPITEDPDSDRVDEEQRNVHLSAYLFATKKEADNDYHLILGSTSSSSHSQFMTAEISGLPRTGPDRAKLKEPRQAYEDYFADSPIGTQYRKFDPPIPVEISGSLFFDVDHAAGVVGPAGFKPKTAWEIHPVTTIVLEP